MNEKKIEQIMFPESHFIGVMDLCMSFFEGPCFLFHFSLARIDLPGQPGRETEDLFSTAIGCGKQIQPGAVWFFFLCVHVGKGSSLLSRVLCREKLFGHRGQLIC